MPDPCVTARWYLWSGYCRWLATRDTCMHRAAAQLALGFKEHAKDNGIDHADSADDIEGPFFWRSEAAPVQSTLSGVMMRK